MVSPNICTQFRWALWQRFLTLACLISFIPFTIAAPVIIDRTPPGYLSNHAGRLRRSNVASPFTVTYLLGDQTTELNLNSIDLIKTARSFERGLSLSKNNILQIRSISLDTAIGSDSKTRRKRFVQCNRDLSGTVLIFDFNFTHPLELICKSQECIDRTFVEVYKEFESVLSLAIDFNNVSIELRLCSIGVLHHTVMRNRPSRSVVQSNAVSITNGSSTTDMMVTTENSSLSIFTSNDTVVDINTCLQKLPMTQETVEPYRIFYTSTLFFQDDHALIVVGASKFETVIDMQTIKRQIIINGVMVYTNCQRTSDVSTPMVCHPSISS